MKKLSFMVVSMVFLFSFFLQPVFGEGTNWHEILAKQPSNQTALYGLSKQLNVPPYLVHTKLLADKLYANYSQTFNNEISFYTLVGCYEALGNYPMARSLLYQTMEHFPKALKPVLGIAYEYYLEGNYPKAIEWYEKGIAMYPRALDGYHGKMLSLLASGNPSVALMVGHEILSRDPRNFFAMLRIGNIHFERKSYQEALNFYSAFPTNIDCKLGMGLCYFRLKQYAYAAPLLKEAAFTYPANPQLMEALHYLNQVDLQKLYAELSSIDPRTPRGLAIKYRMAELYELNGEYANAAGMFKAFLNRSSQVREILRVAIDYGLGGKYAEAADMYLFAVPLSTDRRATLLAAADSLILAGQGQQAMEILKRLESEKPGMDLLSLMGRAYFQIKQIDQGRKCFSLLGEMKAKEASASPDPRPYYIYAIDCFLDAANYPRAGVFLDHLNSMVGGYDLDQRYARLYFEKKDWNDAIRIYRKYPLDLAMQNSKGWAHVWRGEIDSGEKTFKNTLVRDPLNSGAQQGLNYTKNHRPWEIFMGYSTMDYGNYQDDRRLFTDSLRYSYKKVVTSFSHTRTDVISLASGATDFNEDLIGGKIYYGLTPHTAVQLHGLRFSNDDPETDQSVAAGGTFFYYPNNRWITGLEYSSSRYDGYHGSQFSPFAGYMFNRQWRADLKGFLTQTSGRLMRSSQEKNANGANLSVILTPNDRFMLALRGVLGERRLGVDVDGMFAYNTLDVYKDGWSIKAMYKLDCRWKLFASYGKSNFKSEWQDAANEAARNLKYSPDQTVDTLTLGLFYQF